MGEQNRKTWQTSLSASKHLETSVKVFFPPFEESAAGDTSDLNHLPHRDIRYLQSATVVFDESMEISTITFHRLLFAVKPELARESAGRAMNLRFRDSHAHLVPGSREPYTFVSFYLLRADGAFFRTRRDEIRAWTGQRMGYCGLIPMDRPFLYMTLSPSHPYSSERWVSRGI